MDTFTINNPNNKSESDHSLYMRSYTIRIEKHTVVDEKKPFVLYALQLQSEFSKYIVLKQFHNFV